MATPQTEAFWVDQAQTTGRRELERRVAVTQGAARTRRRAPGQGELLAAGPEGGGRSSGGVGPSEGGRRRRQQLADSAPSHHVRAGSLNAADVEVARDRYRSPGSHLEQYATVRGDPGARSQARRARGRAGVVPRAWEMLTAGEQVAGSVAGRGSRPSERGSHVSASGGRLAWTPTRARRATQNCVVARRLTAPRYQIVDPSV